ncbi:MAG: queuosine precursor transporter [Alphaproteobacteria bacterium]|nr:queuosine precursor transporter [Alphaproteobacteria bacterium]MBV9373441.1 queuosine precursor transporter [Alphaproteobacteria bacterium]MBV9900983.1 queuosine precursor transporter [Alphaproteobacteria bacterium]
MDSKAAPAAPRALFALSIFYGGMVCIAGVLGNKQVALGPISRIGDWVGIGPLAVEAGIFAFLLLVATSSAVAELYDRPTANRLVVIGFVPLVVSLLLSELVLALPAAAAMPAERLAAFNTVMGSTPRIWLGGIVAYGTSQLLNVTIFSRLKRETGRLLWLRAAIASVTSQVVDTLLFVTIAFYGVFPIGQLLAGQMLAKVVLSIVAVPVLIYFFVGLGRRLDGAPGQSRI